MAMRDRLLPALLFSLAFIASPAGAQDLLIQAGRVLDVETGRMLEGHDILVRDGRIVSIAPPTKAWIPAFGSSTGPR